MVLSLWTISCILLTQRIKPINPFQVATQEHFKSGLLTSGVVWVVEKSIIVALFLVGFLGLHSMRSMVPEVGCANWLSSTSMTLFFPRLSWDAQRLFCTCVHAWKTKRPQEVPFLLCGHLRSCQVIGEGQEKMVHPSRISKYYSPSLLPCQDWLYLYFSLQFCVYTWVFFCHLKRMIAFFNSVSEQRYEIFLLLVYWVKGSKHSIALYVLSTTVQRHIWPTDCESSWEEAQRFSKPQNHMLKIIVWKVIVPRMD